jgi:hypothetical protein
MNTTVFRSLFLFSFLLHLTLILSARENRFIYIQTENKQAFYIKMDKRILSSSTSGYIIIPKLIDSTYKFSIGFPKNEWPEQNVTIRVKGTDAGYLLKNFAEKGWGLLNLQTKEVLMPQKNRGNSKVIETETSGDVFASILASVVNDPSINQKIIIKNEELAIEEIPETKTEEKLFIKEDSVLDKVNISKLRVDTTAEGILIYYLDIVNEIADTIKLFIPVEKPAVAEELVKQADPPKSLPVRDDPQKKDSRFIDMELPNPNMQIDSGLKKTDDFIGDSSTTDLGTKKRMTSTDCKKTAAQNDFLNLRKQMAAEENENDMIKVANKQFISICFTTEQIKNLGTLFITEEGRYKFFVAAFSYVSDSQNYGLLQDQLTDKYYISRFNAMILN